MKKTVALILLAVMLLGALCGCREEPTPSKTPLKTSYTLEKTMTENTAMSRNIYTIQVIPNDAGESNKVPVIIYVHGGEGDANTCLPVAKKMADHGVAGVAFECCGGVEENPQSDGAELFPSHYTSRISDLEAIYAFVKTLPYVDTDRIYLYGSSYGGIVCSLDAIRHNEDLKGLILCSSGLQEGIMSAGNYNGVVQEYMPTDPFAEILQYTGDVLVICGTADTTNAWQAGKNQVELYNTRESGTATFVSLENEGHGYAAFTPTGKAAAIDAIAAFLEGHE